MEEENRTNAGVTRISRVGYQKTREGIGIRRNETAMEETGLVSRKRSEHKKAPVSSSFLLTRRRFPSYKTTCSF